MLQKHNQLLRKMSVYMNNVFDAYWKEEVEDSVSGCTVEPVLKITCEGLSPCIRWSVRKAPTEFSMHYVYFYIVYRPPCITCSGRFLESQLYYNNGIQPLS